MTGIIQYLSVITLDVNGLNSPVKDRLADWIKIKNLTICCMQETHLIRKEIHKLEKKRIKKQYSKQQELKNKQG